MALFGRLFKIGQSEVHAVVDKLEDPVKMTEQGIRDLKSDLENAMTGLAEVKGVAIRLAKEAEDARRHVDEYERKAVLLLQRGKDGQLDMPQADRLATEALSQRELVSQRATKLAKDANQQQELAAQLQQKVQQLKTAIQTYENELVMLRARAKTAESTKRINQQLAKVDASSTIAMLERMKQKVETEEALAEGYGEIAQLSGGVDAEIDKALLTAGPSAAETQLLEMKRKMGLLPPGELK